MRRSVSRRCVMIEDEKVPFEVVPLRVKSLLYHNCLIFVNNKLAFIINLSVKVELASFGGCTIRAGSQYNPGWKAHLFN